MMVIGCWLLDICDLSYVEEVDDEWLVVKDELVGFLVEGDEVWVVVVDEGEVVEDDEVENGNDGGEDGLLEFFVYEFFGVLMMFVEVFEGEVQRVEGLDVEVGYGFSKWEYDQEDEQVCLKLVGYFDVRL